MLRCAYTVRDASPEDADALIALWADGDPGVDAGPAGRREAVAALARLAADPDERLVVGELDGSIVAALHMKRCFLGPLSTESAVHTTHLIVHPDCRRHGFARALLECAVSWAEEKGVEHVSAVVDSSSRECNRFFARLGLTTLATVRIAPTAALRLNLSRLDLRGRTQPARHLGQVVAHRRSLRRRQAAGS
ncbi:MAG TPA: GNAT family N-acetyltransferase [Marmoricola sp.]|nr:GNAT family N-acetyltransferase [Marmoricola sp.]